MNYRAFIFFVALIFMLLVVCGLLWFVYQTVSIFFPQYLGILKAVGGLSIFFFLLWMAKS